MRYILSDTGYIDEIAFGAIIECKNNTCTEYTGEVPSGYESLVEWADNANIRAYNIVEGNLTYDSEEDARLQAVWEEEQASCGRNIITVGLSADTTYKSSSLTVAFDTILNKKGNKLSLDDTNKAVKIGAGVSKILVSGTIMQKATSAGLYGGNITKNAKSLASAINVGFNYIPTANQMFKTTLHPILIDVVEGDLIYLVAYTQNSATVTLEAYSGRTVNLTVEVIE